jgi:hypothetical protein
MSLLRSQSKVYFNKNKCPLVATNSMAFSKNSMSSLEKYHGTLTRV